METILLASASPRRAAILRSIGIPFRAEGQDCAEDAPEGMTAAEAAAYLAERKARAAAAKMPPETWILGADTLVSLDGKRYGKPRDDREAASFLRAFSGKTVTAESAVAVWNARTGATAARVSGTLVTFAPLSEADIARHTAGGGWRGAAGGFRLQGEAARFISRVSGSPSGVVGLPVFELCDTLSALGYSFSGGAA